MYDEDNREKHAKALKTRQFVQFLIRNKCWWLIPMIIVFGLVVLLVVLSRMGSPEPLRTGL
jgi:hypothetical protein